MYVPTKVFFTRGVGRHTEKLSSFEMALRRACIAKYNLIRVSSILPPGCRHISTDAGIGRLKPGQIIHVVMSEASTNEPNRMVAASIGVAIPNDRSQFGYLAEHHAYGMTGPKAGDYAEDLAAEMLATIMGVGFDPATSWDEKREIWRISGKIVRSTNVTQSARGQKDGHWTTVIAAAVLLP